MLGRCKSIQFVFLSLAGSFVAGTPAHSTQIEYGRLLTDPELLRAAPTSDILRESSRNQGQSGIVPEILSLEALVAMDDMAAAERLIESGLFCASETDLILRRIEIQERHKIPFPRRCGSSGTINEIVFVYEDHWYRSGAAARRDLYLAANRARPDFVLASEALVRNYSTTSLIRAQNTDGVREARFVGRDGLPAPSPAAPQIYGLDEENPRAEQAIHRILNFEAEPIYRTGRSVDTDAMVGQRRLRAAVILLFEEAVKNPHLRSALDSLLTLRSESDIERFLGQDAASSDPAVAAILRAIADSSPQNELGRKFRDFAFGILNAASFARNVPGGHQLHLHEIEARASFTRFREVDDFSVYAVLMAIDAAFRRRRAAGVDDSAIGYLLREWGFLANVSEALCGSSAVGHRRLVINLGAGHAERLAFMIRSDLRFQGRIRFLNANRPRTGGILAALRSDVSEDPRDVVSPTQHCVARMRGAREAGEGRAPGR